MTKDEAITILKTMKNSTTYGIHTCDALGMGIKALEESKNDVDSIYEHAVQKAIDELPLPTITTAGEPIAFFGPTGIGLMWHKYPEEKPPKEDAPYLITCEYIWGEERFVTEAFWGDVHGVTLWFEIDSRGNKMPLTLQVFAWAEMPEPYKEKTDGNN